MKTSFYALSLLPLVGLLVLPAAGRAQEAAASPAAGPAPCADLHVFQAIPSAKSAPQQLLQGNLKACQDSEYFSAFCKLVKNDRQWEALGCDRFTGSLLGKPEPPWGPGASCQDKCQALYPHPTSNWHQECMAYCASKPIAQ